VPECNSVGLAMMGGKPLSEAFERLNQGEAGTMIILENDLYRRAEKEKVDHLFAKSKHLIVLDHLITATTSKANIVLPVGTYAESEGTLVNNEGRAQRFYQALSPKDAVMESWRRIAQLMRVKDQETFTWSAFDQLVNEMTEALPQFSKVKDHLPDADFRMLNEKIKRQTARFSGRTAITANIHVSEPKPPQDVDSPLVFSMEGADQTPPSSLVTHYWKPGWNSYQAMNFYLDEPNGSLKGGDPGILLFDEQSEHQRGSFTFSIPQKTAENQWLILPVYCIFGSEELSNQASAIKERIPQPFVLVSSKVVQTVTPNGRGMVRLEIGDISIEVLLKIDDSLPSGVMGLSVNLPGMEYVQLPGVGKLI